MEDSMTDLNREARTLLRQGRGLGEPSDAAVARVRASLMRRVGVATTVVATGSAIGKAATAARAASIGASLVTRVVAVTALVSAGVAGGYAYQGRASRSAAESTAQGAPSLHTPLAHARATVADAPHAAPSAPQTDDAERGVAPPAAPSAPVARESSVVPSAPVARSAESPPVPTRAAKSPATGASLSEDVAALRAAQAALLAGNPQQAIEVGARVRPDGPLGAEREGLLLVARCALGAPDALSQARDFARRHAGSPLALRVERACRLDDDFETKRGGGGHP
jgi:hypothetical protein